MAEPLVTLAWRPFRLPLARPLVTAQGTLTEKRGWLLRLEADRLGAPAGLGWGEAAPLCFSPALAQGHYRQLAAAIESLGSVLPRQALEASLPSLPPELAFALGLALAEADGLVGAAAGGWLAAPTSAVLLPAGEAAVVALAAALERTGATPLTCKWKVAAAGDQAERQVLERLLAHLPADSRLRLDANGGWDRATVWQWAERLAEDPRLEWLEQPLAPGDLSGLQELARRVPVALDESLQVDPALRRHWPSWQVRRPAVEGDPRPLLAALQLCCGGASASAVAVVLSTAFETGIAGRMVGHLAALQSRGATPTAPGLAPGWQLASRLCATDPETVWQAAGAGL
ncbi:o-succinylbenzoate synthase [Synechococcus sp. CS-1324]|uniref:o-succinylbenzoate synthase n=1 Tax=Synechococcus sp. CS-1324 TaxID=2847980 RepID=UPI00223B3EB6|nr:o-succinylbenzoate synthase [Synechococcus sp. CS-1324]MCT0231360.1 o-succinylbenzoate synthase [Synechococcus sp. CS-1324]